ncbi:MAG: hypothetical protein EHM34_00195 [Nitrosopumilales archaeon]|nr:MAG: hypothetical protein EHM34_00195 [Nitrosopumilales archaeon]
MSEELPANMKVCLIPVTAQPPTFGMIMSVMAIEQKYDQIIICVEDNPILIPTEMVKKMLSIVFRYPKYVIISDPINFEELVEFPRELPKFNYVATMNDRVHANLSAKGYGCYLIPRAIGYDEYFHRNAFKISQVLELLRSRTTAIPLKKYKKTDPSSEEGE